MSKEESSNEAVGSQDAASASDAPPKDPNAGIYENRGPKKVIRVVTVIAYLFSVSFVGILLSAYYLFLWEPPNPRLIERGRLRAEPQVQLLLAEPHLVDADQAERKESVLSEDVLNRTYRPPVLLSRIAYDNNDIPADDPDETSREDLAVSQRGRLNAMLMKLKYSLIEILRESRRNQTSRSSHEATSATGDSFFTTRAGEKLADPTKNSGYGETSAENVSAAKTRTGDDAGLRPKPTDSSSALPVAAPLSSATSKSVTISDYEPTRTQHFGAVSTPTEVGGETRDSTGKIQLNGPYTVTANDPSDSRSDQEAASCDDGRRNQDNDVSTKRRGNSGGRLDDDREAKPSDETDRSVVASEKRPNNSRTRRSPSANSGSNSVNCSKSQPNCSGNECRTNNRTERIARDRVSIDSPTIRQPISRRRQMTRS